MFDELFRGHLQNVYATIGLPVPLSLKEPIRKSGASLRTRGVSSQITPRLTAEANVLEEWSGAGVVASQASGGTMQQAETKLARVLYGYNADELFFRIEANVDLTPFRLGLYLSTPHAERYNTRPRGAETSWGISLAWEIAIKPSPSESQSAVRVYRADGQEVWKGEWVEVRTAIRDRVVELALARRDLKLEPGESVAFLVTLMDPQSLALVDRLPAAGMQSALLGEL
jgi:hypothetical protein